MLNVWKILLGGLGESSRTVKAFFLVFPSVMGGTSHFFVQK